MVFIRSSFECQVLAVRYVKIMRKFVNIVCSPSMKNKKSRADKTNSPIVDCSLPLSIDWVAKNIFFGIFL